MTNALVWFRNDLRLDDNPALQAAIDAGHTPIPVYIHAPDEEGHWAPGAASNAWRHRSLAALSQQLHRRGTRLRLFAGPSLPMLQALLLSCEAQAVFWNRRYEPLVEQRDTGIKAALRAQGIQVESFNGSVLREPWQTRTKAGGPYKVFTPFWRASVADWSQPPLQAAPDTLLDVDVGPDGVALDALHLAPARGWDASFWETWTPGEQGAHEALSLFIDGALRGYKGERDRPDRVGTSRLSPHLHFGEIAPWRVVAALEAQRSAATAVDIDAHVRQLWWRDFAHHLLHHFPHTTDANLDTRFDRFAWASPQARDIRAWQQGRTGVPIVDAGMRQLWRDGWMHNRVRLIAGSYLCKHMRQHWLVGARWFWDTLVDADLANNSLGWQWIAGTGADAAPYFRVFNPVTQAARFDPDGRYIAAYVPELATLPVPDRFAPWTAPQAAGALAGAYPMQPIVALAEGRDAALEAYRASR